MANNDLTWDQFQKEIINSNQTNPNPSWQSGLTFGNGGNPFTISSPAQPDKSEIVFKSRSISGIYYILTAELDHDAVKLIGNVFVNTLVKDFRHWVVFEGKSHAILLEAHKWAQEIIEKKIKVLQIFEDLVAKGKEEVRAKIAKCEKKYIDR